MTGIGACAIMHTVMVDEQVKGRMKELEGLQQRLVEMLLAFQTFTDEHGLTFSGGRKRIRRIPPSGLYSLG